MLEAGEILQERYRIEKQIGQGGMGSVYLATDERFNSIVAIKETLFTDENYLKAFSREARLLNSLKHTALPKVSDHFIDDNGQYIVMEYIAGEDLFDMIEQSGEAFPLDDVKIWADQLLDALDYLHGQSNPIIHRDIKPQNLKLTPQGQVILLDFGLAKGNPTDAKHQTAANSIFGYSRNYASLEQIQGTGTDPRSDIYSLAATMYHLLTGKPPADALTRVMMVLNEEKDPLQPAHLIHEQVPEDLSNALQEAMSLNANLRPQSAIEMRELLSGERKAKTVSTKPNTVANKAAGTNLYTQNTKVFTDGESPELKSKQDAIKTEVLGVGAINNDSVKTKIAKPITLNDKKQDTINVGTVTHSNPKRSWLFAAASLGILLLVGTVVSMVIMLNQESNNLQSEPSVGFDANAATGNAASSIADDLDANSNLELSNTEDSDSILAESETDSNEIPLANESAEMPLKNVPKADTELDVAKKESKEPKVTEKVNNKSNAKASGKNDEVIIKDGKIITKDAIIENGRIETKDVTINNKGLVINTDQSKDSGSKPTILERDLERLTPKQRKEIKDAFEKQRRAKEIQRNRRMRNGRRPPPPPPRSPRP